MANAQGAIGYLDCCQDLKKAPGEVITPDAYNFKNEIVEINTFSYEPLKQGETMKGIYRRKDGRYSVRKQINGIKYEVYTKTFEQARKALIKLKQKQSMELKRITYTYTIEKWLFQWAETYKKPFVNERTYKTLINYCKVIIKHFNNIYINELTTETIQNYLNGLPKNRSKEFITLYFNAALNKAVDLDIIKKNPFNAVIKDKKIKFKRNAFTYAEQQLLLEHIKGTELEANTLCYLMLGCRPNELPTKNDFILEDNLVHIYGTKNESSQHRVVDISEEFANYLTNYFKTNNLLKYSIFQARYAKLCNKIGLKPDVYILRHTFASNMRIMGADMKQVAYYMGHSSIKITMDIYTDIDRSLTKDRLIKLYNNLYPKF